MSLGLVKMNKNINILIFILMSGLSEAKNIEPKIINGLEASPGQFPWQVAIYLSSDATEWLCGGALISDEWVLTAAHCIAHKLTAFVSVGVVNILDQSFTQLRGVDLIVHDRFNEDTLASDIGLVRLERPLTFNDNIKAIDLASDPLEAGVQITISGWGQTSDNSGRENVLHYASMTTIPNSDCDASYGGKSTISEDMFCAGSFTNLVRSTCYGDSGGPAIVDDGEKPVLVGIITFISARGCEYADPSGFVRIDYFKDWISETTGVRV